MVLPIFALGIFGSDVDDVKDDVLLASFLEGGGAAAGSAAAAPLRSPGRLVTELLSAERLILLALSELDLSWPPPLADLMCLLEGPLGGGGLRYLSSLFTRFVANKCNIVGCVIAHSCSLPSISRTLITIPESILLMHCNDGDGRVQSSIYLPNSQCWVFTLFHNLP